MNTYEQLPYDYTWLGTDDNYIYVLLYAYVIQVYVYVLYTKNDRYNQFFGN